MSTKTARTNHFKLKSTRRRNAERQRLVNFAECSVRNKREPLLRSEKLNKAAPRFKCLRDKRRRLKSK